MKREIFFISERSWGDPEKDKRKRTSRFFWREKAAEAIGKGK
jgi:hypothetical protein